jgi:hypothetical protein
MMKLVKWVVGVFIGITVCLALPYGSGAQEVRQLIVVANDQSYELASPWVNFLKTESVPFTRIQPSDFEKYKKEKNIVILGGPTEPDGVGEIVKQALTKEEQDYFREEGRFRMYIKYNIWAPEQNVMVFAGSDSKAAAKARTVSRQKWIPVFNDWLGIDISETGIIAY